MTDGKVDCRDIVGFEWTDAEKVTEFLTSGGRQHCVQLAGDTARIVAEVLG